MRKGVPLTNRETRGREQYENALDHMEQQVMRIIDVLLREQVLLQTREEIPHSVAVKSDRLEDVPASTTPKKRSGYDL